jgi:aspartate aminotransferase
VRLLLGDGSVAVKEGRVATVQSLSGTGSLRVGAAFIQRYFPGKTVYLSNPTWGNHMAIFADAGVPTEMYRYFDADTTGLDFDGMVADLKAAPEGSVVLLHGCAHNPTGIDPTPEQWEQLAELCKEKDFLPFFDVAYQGFASGSLDEDAASTRLFNEKGLEFMCAQSYSKNLGLYGERVGAMNIVLNDADKATAVTSQLKRIARAMYSNPPVHGARIVATVIGDDELYAEWKAEMEMMSGRIKNVRTLLQEELEKRMPEKDWSFVTSQIGMFSYTGLSKEQVQHMWDEWHIYLTFNGRISLAGLSANKTAYLADAIVDALKKVN